MKNLGLAVLIIGTTLVLGSQAEARQKHAKYKVVTVSFTETDARNTKRFPASIDEKQELDAANRLAARAHTAMTSEIPD